MKTYCTCKRNDYVYRGLHSEPLTFKHDYLWVHAECCLPSRLVWEGHLRKCQGCFKETCLPWEVLCQACFRIEQPEDSYRGLLAAAKKARREIQWPLEKTGRLSILSPSLQKLPKLADSI